MGRKRGPMNALIEEAGKEALGAPLRLAYSSVQGFKGIALEYSALLDGLA